MKSTLHYSENKNLISNILIYYLFLLFNDILTTY
jgi:hypothetical protein